ncbi:MAG: DUF1778 domain-containing protein [Rhodocyclales bacterium]|nr:DUF1778 domain-containing protein [Rhodocyclales bacterium]
MKATIAMSDVKIRAKRDTLNLRIKPDVRALIDRAAQVRGKNRTDFILEAACRAAEEALLDRAVFLVGEETWSAFLERLDGAPRPNERLARTLHAPAPWDER